MGEKVFSKSEIRLFELIAGSFCFEPGKTQEDASCDREDAKDNKPYDNGLNDDKTNKDPEDERITWKKTVDLALHHSILPILHGRLKNAPIDDEDRELLDHKVKETATEFYQLMFNARKTIGLLEKGGVKVVLLKGASAARFYPVPETRRSADVDLLLANVKDSKQASDILTNAGYRRMNDEYEANHHQVWGTPDNHVVELHTILVEPFDDRGFNDYINARYKLEDADILREKIIGMEMPILHDDRQAFHLLLHMLMDFMRSGFGLKLLCDWVAFWNRKVEPDRVKAFLNDVRACDVTGFFSVVTSACIRYLGLRTDGSGSFTMKEDSVFFEDEKLFDLAGEELCTEFINDVIDTDSKGKKATDRMVASESTGILGLIREYHHQTVLTFPRASKWIVTLPVLYVIMLIRFLRNNRTVRGGQSVSGIIKETQKRSRLVKRIKETGRQQI